MEALKNSPNNGYYLCLDAEGNRRVLSTNYLARRIGVKPKNTKNELKNWITKVYPYPYKSRKEVLELSQSDTIREFLDISKVPSLYVKRHGRHCPTRYFIYFYFESLIMESIDWNFETEVMVDSINRVRKHFMMSYFREIEDDWFILRSRILPENKEFIQRLFDIIYRYEYLHPKSESYKFLFPEKYNRKL